MIEKNVVNILDLGTSNEKIDVYQKDNLVCIFMFLKTLTENNNFSSRFFISIKLISFIQFICISIITKTKNNKDYVLYFFQYLSGIFLFQQEIKENKLYIISLIIIISIIFILIFFFISIYILIKRQSINNYNLLIKFPNILIQIIVNYLIGPSISVCLLSMKFLESNIDSSRANIVIFIISILSLIFYILLTTIFYMFYVEIGYIGQTSKVKYQIKSKYDIIFNLSKILSFIFHYIVNSYYPGNKILQIIYVIFLLLAFIILIFYAYKYCFYYDKRMHILTNICILMIFWFIICFSLKLIFNLNSITLLIAIGWILLLFTIKIEITYKYENTILTSHIFEFKNIKQLEMFIIYLVELVTKNKNDKNTKIIIKGYFMHFKQYISSFPEMNEIFNKFEKIHYLNKSYNSNIFTANIIIYILYNYYLEKNTFDNFSLNVNFCYFLINKFQNPTLAAYYCAKIKCVSFMELYYKFILSENINDYLINRTDKNISKKSIKHIQFSKVILYNLYHSLLKIKIYDISYYQTEYFDYFKNFTVSTKNTINFLNLGNDILKLRKKIKQIWDNVIKLNPFCEEIYNDYMLYLETLIQDETLLKSESKIFTANKNLYIDSKNDFLYKIFDNLISSVLLINGESDNEGKKILYVSPNFFDIYSLNIKDISTLKINDLIPNPINIFHDHLMEEVLYYSNLNKIKKQLNVFIKTKYNAIISTKMFINQLPNLSRGLIYIVHLEKSFDNDFTILLNKDFIITAFSEKVNNKKSLKTINKENFGLNYSVIGSHIIAIIPEIIFLMQNNERNEVSLLNESNSNQKAKLYPINNNNNSAQKLLVKINEFIKLMNKNDGIDLNKVLDKYIDLISNIKEECSRDPFKIIYSINKKTFLDDKYWYYILKISENITEKEIIDKSIREINSIEDIKCSYIDKELQENKIQKQIKFRVKLSEKHSETKMDNESNEKENNLITKNNINEEKVILDKKYVTKTCDFTKLKNIILSNKIYTKYKLIMILLSFMAFVINLFFIIYNTIRQRSNMVIYNKYLQENAYYNQTKIAIGHVYITLTNLQLFKFDFYSSNYSSINITVYSKILNNLKKSMENLYLLKKEDINFSEPHQAKIKTNLNTSLINCYRPKEDRIISLTFSQLLKLLHTNCLNFLYNVNTYLLNNTDNKFEYILQNLVSRCEVYIFSNIWGFDDEEIITELNNKFYLFPFPTIVATAFTFISFIVYIYCIYMMNSTELNITNKLIYLNSPSYEEYIKTLKDLQNRYRIEDNDEDEQSGKNDDEEDDFDFFQEKRKSSGDDNKKKNKKKKMSKEVKEKRMQLLEQRNKKIKILAKKIYTKNIFILIEIILAFIISFTYFMMIPSFDKKSTYKVIDFNKILESIDKVYIESFIEYIKLKKECMQFISHNISMNLQKNNEFFPAKFDTSIMQLLNYKDDTKINKIESKLFNLYNSNACNILFTIFEEINQCEKFWNGVISRGLQQTLLEKENKIYLLLNMLHELNNRIITIKEFTDNYLYEYDDFIGDYLYEAFIKSMNLFNELRNIKIGRFKTSFNYILYCYIFVCIFAFILLFYLDIAINEFYENFIKFVVIIPSDILIEDEKIHEEIKKIEKDIIYF